MDLVKRVAIVGSGNWGSAIAKIIGANTARYPHFHTAVKMYVHEEEVEHSGTVRPLSEVINETHENVKYLPGHQLPVNVIADPDLLSTVVDADILIFVTPDAFIIPLCRQMKPALKRGVIGISLIKSFATLPNGDIGLLSNEIQHTLGIAEVAVLMGANLAHEVAEGHFCETTIGVRTALSGKILKHLFQTDNFRVTYVQDVFTVEGCGAIKNIIGCAAGFVDGLGHGDNTKAAVMRLGLAEMIRFCQTYFPKSCRYDTFFESCGVADLIATCYGGRNRRLAEAFITTKKSIQELEEEHLHGQKWEGVLCCQAMALVLEKRGLTEKFPLFTSVSRIFSGDLPPNKFIKSILPETSN